MLDKIKQLRESTGLGMMMCKDALHESNGDVDKAIEILRKKGALKAAKRSEREIKEGTIAVYLHSNNKVASMVKVGCETDFVAKNEDFIAFANDIAMHITAMSPRYVDPSEVSEEDVEKEKEIYREQLANEGKPADMIEKIIEGKVKKFAEESALLKQPFVKDPTKTVEDLVLEINGKVGENVKIVEFCKFDI